VNPVDFEGLDSWHLFWTWPQRETDGIP